uniref:SGNH hydrolase-type esterase domain-containing protein n=1 Tax=viral metagenome TaxID=1070528 RepID=A0A6C0HZ03_9ZZZZ
MIRIFGDSHAEFSFKNLKLPNNNYFCYSITMFRIGRDNVIINFNKNIIKKNDIIVLSYGEVDCRCHINKQINLGINEDDIINQLVNKYITTIKNNTINLDVKIIIVGVIPPTKKSNYEIENGKMPNNFPFPFLGSDQDRVRYTNKVNKLLEELSVNNNYIYFNPYSYYTTDDGTLKYEFSDKNVHLKENSYFLEKFTELYKSIQF